LTYRTNRPPERADTMTATAAPAPIIRTHLNASEWTTDTETTVTVLGRRVLVRVRLLPHLRYWSAPTAAQIRGWVDEALVGTGKKRDGARVVESGGAGWTYVYYLTAV